MLLIHPRGSQCVIFYSQLPSWPSISICPILQTEREAEEYVKRIDFVIFLIKAVGL